MNMVDAHPDVSNSLLRQFRAVRAHTEYLASALSAEDQCIQSMADASPAKWHRAHTTWFFEEFVLTPRLAGYRIFDPTYRFLFNSYYETVGTRHPRPARGMLTRPSAEQVTRYREHVDAGMARLLEQDTAAYALTRLGLQHEQQHQELLVTDMLHGFAQSPLFPPVQPDWCEPRGQAGPTRFLPAHGGVVDVGHPVDDTGAAFAFDNETPRHQMLLQPHRIADRLVRNREWTEFIRDGGYATVALWMSDGWAALQSQGWTAPLYWHEREDGWWQMGPGGLARLDPECPVRHISWYEADAYARWAGARLPTEFEFEDAAATLPLYEVSGHAWQWTASAYLPYPGFAPAPGAIGEYNGKFMINQMVLRGGSFATPPGHARPTYRNFFHPEKRWQVTGLRLAKDDR